MTASDSTRTAPTVATYDERLQAARALDWRFLLPSPEMRRVLLATETKSQQHLRSSLDAAACEVIDWDERSELFPKFSVVVTDMLNSSSLEILVKHLAFDGALVILSDRVKQRKAIGRWWGMNLHSQHRQLQRCLAPMGRFTVTAWWHSPNRSNCKTLVPLDDSTAVEQYVSSQLPGRGWRPFKAFAARLIRAGLLVHHITWIVIPDKS